jgi:hypothetical protein
MLNAVYANQKKLQAKSPLKFTRHKPAMTQLDNIKNKLFKIPFVTIFESFM